MVPRLAEEGAGLYPYGDIMFHTEPVQGLPRLPSDSCPFNWAQAGLGIPTTYILTTEVEPDLSQGRHAINRSLAAAEATLMCDHNGTSIRLTSQQRPFPTDNPEVGRGRSLFWLIKGWATRRISIETIAPLCQIFIDLRSLHTRPGY